MDSQDLKGHKPEIFLAVLATAVMLVTALASLPICIALPAYVAAAVVHHYRHHRPCHRHRNRLPQPAQKTRGLTAGCSASKKVKEPVYPPDESM